MSNFAEYYRDLLAWEGVPFQPLIEAWPTELVRAVESDLKAAVLASGIKDSLCSITPGSTNQSIGNQVEKHTMGRLVHGCAGFRIEPCSGAGYPDKMLVQLNPALRLAFEVKATSDWNPADSSRRVLTSSSEKIRQAFRPPVHHLLCTVLYTLEIGGARIGALRLDFLEPTTPVNVRLEASVNHKLLATAAHFNVML